MNMSDTMPEPAFLTLPETIAKKPPHGGPCNRCGLCCMMALCPLGQHVFGLPEFAGKACPALEQVEDGYRCGIVANPAAYTSKTRVMRSGVEALRRAALLLIGAGDGCDARSNGEPYDSVYVAALLRKCTDQARQLLKAKRMWSGR